MTDSAVQKPSDFAKYSKPALVRLLDYLYERQERQDHPQSDDDWFFCSPLSLKNALGYLEEFTELASLNEIETRLACIRVELQPLYDGKLQSSKVQIRCIELQDERERLWKRRDRISKKRLKRLDEEIAFLETTLKTTAESAVKRVATSAR